MNSDRLTGNIELHINELVLHGFPRGDRHRIAEAIRQELQKQLGVRGLPDALARQVHVAHLNAGAIQAQPGGNPEHIGMQVARAVYSSVAGQESHSKDARSLSRGLAGSIDRSG